MLCCAYLLLTCGCPQVLPAPLGPPLPPHVANLRHYAWKPIIMRYKHHHLHSQVSPRAPGTRCTAAAHFSTKTQARCVPSRERCVCVYRGDEVAWLQEIRGGLGPVLRLIKVRKGEQVSAKSAVVPCAQQAGFKRSVNAHAAAA